LCNAFEHEIIPARGTIWAAAFEFGTGLKNVQGFDLTALNHYRMGTMVDLDGMIEKGTKEKQSTMELGKDLCCGATGTDSERLELSILIHRWTTCPTS